MASSSLDDGINSSSNLDGRGRFFRVCRLLVDGGTDLLRQEFDKIIPPGDLPKILSKEEVNLRKLKSFILTASMFQKLYPSSNTYGKSTDFDISLLMVLFRQLCRMKAPLSSNNWKDMPIDSDKTVEADILRLKIYRNAVIAHAETCSIPSDEFEQVSQNIITIFERRGGEPWKLKAERMLKEALTQSENAYLMELKDWHQHETDTKEICKQLDTKTDEMLYRAGRIEENVRDISNKLEPLSVSGLSFREFKDIKEIGQGIFSKVFKGTHKIDQRICAIKQSHMSFEDPRIQRQFTKEVEIISRLSHQNVVIYYASFLDEKGCCCIVMKHYMKDLGRCFKSQSDMKNLIKPKSISIFSDIISGLEYIHGKGIIHRDLRPANIFLSSLDGQCQAVIGDFGLACFENQSFMSYAGSFCYKAPEQSSGNYDNKVDMFSAGIILFELSKLEWEDPNDQTKDWSKVLRDLGNKTGEVLKRFDPFRPEFVRGIVGLLLENSPQSRLSATEVREELRRHGRNKVSENSGMHIGLHYVRAKDLV